ncbi:guanine nucleotide binding protein, alpha subunit [Glonium stellatum]|uniref:Guanine nucleotide binding protein, alpha subunit n=1 Tax=Glonium stellatum TaxID=574774 RepID=A0A8E2JYC3_9PEZI|nr:guanine nucleotide binding protein, alpha subunit [Glonium stellatum]
MRLGPLCFGSNPDSSSSAKHQEIESIIRADKKRAKKEVKILLLGAGESGKSTVMKQMRITHSGGFSKTEREQWRHIIFHNLIDAFRNILAIMRELEIEFEDGTNTSCVEIIETDPKTTAEDEMSAEYLHAFSSLWADRGVQFSILKGNEYALHDNLNYYFSMDINRLFAKDYLPTNQDILVSRLRTTGTTEISFEVGNVTYKMVDVGGQRSERRKWIHVFDNVQVLLFLVAISGFDQGLVEDKGGNQMREALMLFKSIANSSYFRKSALILFLNKIDIFNEKVSLGMGAIQKHFSEYQGGPNDVKAGKEFFAKKFKNLVDDREKQLYIHYTNATDTDLLEKTMESVRQVIIKSYLEAYGL